MRVVNAMILATFLRVLRRGTLKNRFRRPKPDSNLPARISSQPERPRSFSRT